MKNDRFGIRWGLAGGTTLASIDEAREAARFAEEIGADSFWISHAAAVDSIVALACIGKDFPRIGEIGTSVIAVCSFYRIIIDLMPRKAVSSALFFSRMAFLISWSICSFRDMVVSSSNGLPLQR